MKVIGVIPVVLTEKYPSFILPALFPIDYDVVDGKRQLRPIIQVVLDGMVNAGVEMIVCVVNEANMEVMRYFKTGEQFGIPVVYLWTGGNNIAAAVNSAYAMTRGNTVLMAIPGVVDRKSIIGVLNRHHQGGQAVTVSVAPNASATDGMTNKGLQLTGVYAWSPRFTEHLRSTHLVQPNDSFDEIVSNASRHGMVSVIKYAHAPMINTTTAYTNLLNMDDQAPEYVPSEPIILQSEL